jgi:hypothetical protein
MGRRKVDPANRLRAARACQPCKQSKKRCNAHWPCSNCLRRGIRSQCVYEETSNHQTPQSRPTNPITPPDVVVADAQSSHLIGSLATPHRSLQNDQHQHQEAVPTPSISTHETVPSSPEIRHQLHPRLLRDGHGPRHRAESINAHIFEVTVYIGSSASLAFLQFIRDAVSTSTSGNSRFEQDPSVKVMLEVAQPSQCNLGPDESLDASTKAQYGCDFRIIVSHMYRPSHSQYL